MAEKDSVIENEDLKEVTGGKGYWEGPGIKFSSDEGDWHKGDEFQCSFSGSSLERLILADDGVFVSWYNGHKYNANRYDWFTNEHKGTISVTDRQISDRTWDITQVKK